MEFLALGGFIFLSIVLGLMMSNWLMIILIMEMGLFFFIFMCLSYGSMGVTRSCFKYFIIQSLSSLLLFLGGLVLLGLVKLDNNLYHLALNFGFLMKLGGFPMLFWVIPIMLELPYMMVGIVGCPLKVIPLSLYSAYYSSYSTSLWSYLLTIISLLTMLMGVWLGIYTKTIRSMLGASSVTHTGWFILGVISSSVMQYFLLYTIGFVLVLYLVINNNLFLSSVHMLSLAGLPPFSIFVGKMVVVKASMSCGIPMLFMVLALLVSAFSLYYYLTFSFNMYMYNKLHLINSGPILSISIFTNGLAGLLYCLYFLWPSSP